ncbi:MAG TPA: selenocysteine-specific translation elongation factor [Anaerolineaceae bacterium]
MRVIGTAGHVDHGKSTLVAALTGVHPDRLKEEQEREMTIDLGFGWMNLPGGEEVGIVDVPGHRDFIENMLAGVGGIDAVLFVVAADEGVMPQTREHLAILDILQISAGIIVLTKIDLVDDLEWLELVEADIRQVVQGTVLADAPVARVSARSGAGITDLRNQLAQILAAQPVRLNLGRPRLPVDRVFTIAGFGTVVTGTLLDGQLSVGDEIVVLPGEVRGRVRGLQSHKHKQEIAVPGSRTAVNLGGVNLDQVHRGDVLALLHTYRPTRLVDVSFRLLKDATAPIRHNSEVKFFVGTAEVIARLRLLGVEELRPGEEGWLQLELDDPVVTGRGDRYILRRPSPGETLGGGAVVDPHPAQRHRRFDANLIRNLEAVRGGTPAEVLLQSCIAAGAASLREVTRRAHLNGAQAQAAIQELLSSGDLFVLESGSPLPESDLLVIPRGIWQAETSRAAHELQGYHRSFPLRRGMLKEELKSRLKLHPRLFNAYLRKWVVDGIVRESATLVSLYDHAVNFNPGQQMLVDNLLAHFASKPFEPPTVKESIAEAGEDIFQALVDLGMLVQVSSEVVFRKQDYDQMLLYVQQHFQETPTLTVAQLRDRLNTSRRYVLAFLEHLDTTGVTLRDGDVRRLRQSIKKG